VATSRVGLPPHFDGNPIDGELRPAPANAQSYGFVSPPVFSFLPRALPQRVSLLRDFDPARGSRRQLDSLLVVAPPEAESSVVFLTVTAI
jgi:hypothetical protein